MLNGLSPRGARRCAAVLVALVTALAAGPAALAQPLRARLSAALDRPDLADAFWGALVVDAATGEVLYGRNETKRFMPASNAKLYTTAAALDLAGPNHRYTTRLYTTGPVEGGVLRGDLVVVGAGDPAIGGRFNGGDRTAVFRAWADSLRALGVTRVAGRVVGVDDLFDDVPLGAGWAWDDEAFYYSAELSALSFNDNCVDVVIEGTSPGAPGRVRWEPAMTDYVTVANETVTGGPFREGYARDRGTNRITLTSRVPAGGRDAESLTVSNPTRFFAHVLRETLGAAGLPVEGAAVDADDLPAKPDAGALRPVASHTSVPMRDLVAVVNKQSQNLYADLLLKLLGTLPGPAPNEDRPMGSHGRGLEVAKAFFGRAGMDTTRFSLVDGSGLSRSDLVTPAMTVALLRYMHTGARPLVREAFAASLPVGGVDGTLRGRFTSGPARANVRAKTGSLGGVSSLAGYVTTRSGRTLAFALMCNHFTTPSAEARRAQDAVVELLAGME